MEISSFISSQREKGLQSGDFELYKRYLGKRIVTLRRNLSCSTSSNKRQAPQKAISLQDIQRNQEFANLLLLTSERSWAQAMQMRAARQDNSSVTKSASSRRQSISKLHKAAASATHLLSLVEDETSGFDHNARLQAQAYQAFLYGALAFEKRHWKDSLQHYSKAYIIHGQLSPKDNTISDANSWAFANSFIDANLRYSAYQIGISRSTPIEKIVKDYVIHDDEVFRRDLEDSKAQTPGQFNTNLNGPGEDDNLPIPGSIQWRSRTVKLEDATTARTLAQVKRAEDELSAFFTEKTVPSPLEDAAAYDNVLIASQDAVDAVKTAIDELSAEGVAHSDSRIQALQITRTAVHYSLISWRIGRNRVLCGNADGLETLFPHHFQKTNSRHHTSPLPKSKNRLFKEIKEQVVLVDSILQSLESVESLPGVASDTTFVEEIRQKKAYFNALRCLAIAQSHHTIENYSSSLSLLSKARSFLTTVKNAGLGLHSRDADGPPQLEISDIQLNKVRSLIDVSIRERQGIAEVENSVRRRKLQAESYNTPIVEDLSEFSEISVSHPNIISWPPKVEPIPMKPIFLDVAYNYIKYPGMRGREVENVSKPNKIAAENSAPRKGWFGFGR